jgi:hypothetical protein
VTAQNVATTLVTVREAVSGSSPLETGLQTIVEKTVTLAKPIPSQ